MYYNLFARQNERAFFQCVSSSFLCVPRYIVVDIQRQLTIFLSAAWHALIELCDWNWNKTRPRQQLWVWFPDERPEEDAKLPPSLPLPVDVNENLGAELTPELKVGITKKSLFCPWAFLFRKYWHQLNIVWVRFLNV